MFCWIFERVWGFCNWQVCLVCVSCFFRHFLPFFEKSLLVWAKVIKRFFFCFNCIAQNWFLYCVGLSNEANVCKQPFFWWFKIFWPKNTLVDRHLFYQKPILTYWLLTKGQDQWLRQQNIAFAKCLMTNSLFAKYLLDRSVFPKKQFAKFTLDKCLLTKCLLAKCLLARCLWVPIVCRPNFGC